MTDCVFCRIASGNEEPTGKLWYRNGEVAVFTNKAGDIVVVPTQHEPTTLVSLAWQAEALFRVLHKTLINRGLADRPMEIEAHLNGYHVSVPHLHVVARLK